MRLVVSSGHDTYAIKDIKKLVLSNREMGYEPENNSDICMIMDEWRKLFNEGSITIGVTKYTIADYEVWKKAYDTLQEIKPNMTPSIARIRRSANASTGQSPKLYAPAPRRTRSRP